MDWGSTIIGTIIGGIIGFLSSLGILIVTRWLEKRDQRKNAFEWLRVEVERNLDRIRAYRKKESEWREVDALFGYSSALLVRNVSK